MISLLSLGEAALLFGVVQAIPLQPSLANGPPISADNGNAGGIFDPDLSLSGALGTLGSFMGSVSDDLVPSSVQILATGAPQNPTGARDSNSASSCSTLDAPASGAWSLGGGGQESPPPVEYGSAEWSHPGTGLYPAHYVTDASLPGKTIYVPQIVPKDNVSMPVVVWGEGGCFKTGTLFQPFLTEIASHGYMVIANGPPTEGTVMSLPSLARIAWSGQTKVSDLQESINWVKQGNAKKYGNVDKYRIAAAGQSCGGCEALSISYHNDDVKLTMLLNSGTLADAARPWLKELRYPVAYINGGPSDIAYQNGVKDFAVHTAPVMMVNIDAGHTGTYFTRNGGKMAKAAVAWLQWNLRQDEKAETMFWDVQSPGSLVSMGFNVTARNWQ